MKRRVSFSLTPSQQLRVCELELQDAIEAENHIKFLFEEIQIIMEDLNEKMKHLNAVIHRFR